VILVISVSVFLALSMALLALFWWVGAKEESLERRFREVISPPAAASAAAPARAWDRIARLWRRPDNAATRREEIVARITGDDLAGHRLLLGQAGYRSPSAERIYWWTRISAPVLFPLVLAAAGKFAGMSDRILLLLAMAGAAAGLALPGSFLKWKARKRQEEITDALPDALDLMTVCVEAGLGINSAFVRIAEEFRLPCPTLSEEFDIVNREMVAGKPRVDALRSLSDRTGVEDVKSLVAMLIQTERLGTSLAQSLRTHSDSLRIRRRQRAEEAAAKTTIKLVFPLVFLLFPALFIVILGPGVLKVLQVLFPAMDSGGG
jgi:tight adherence protein C